MESDDDPMDLDLDLDLSATEIPSYVKTSKQFYGYYVATMQDHVCHQASIISRAPNRTHFMESLRLMEDLMQQGSDVLGQNETL